MMTIPEAYKYEDNLESSRLRTRFLNESDAEIWERFFSDPLVVEFFPNPGNLNSGQRAAVWMDKQLNRYRERHFGLQALIGKKSGAFVGQCGLLLQEVEGKTEVEVGYHIFPEYRGKGYAPEAARLFIDYAFHNNICGSVVSIIHQNNLRSQSVAVKNGLTREKKSVYWDLPVYVYRILKP